MPGAPGTVYSKSIHVGGMAQQAGMEALPTSKTGTISDLHPSAMDIHARPEAKCQRRSFFENQELVRPRLWFGGVLCGMELAQARLEF